MGTWGVPRVAEPVAPGPGSSGYHAGYHAGYHTEGDALSAGMQQTPPGHRPGGGGQTGMGTWGVPRVAEPVAPGPGSSGYHAGGDVPFAGMQQTPPGHRPGGTDRDGDTGSPRGRSPSPSCPTASPPSTGRSHPGWVRTPHAKGQPDAPHPRRVQSLGSGTKTRPGPAVWELAFICPGGFLLHTNELQSPTAQA